MRYTDYVFDVPEEKQVRVIIDTDAKNEADDQFAVAHALMSPKLDVVGICAEHYADRFGPDSEQQSYDEILHLLRLMGIQTADPGSEGNGGIPVLHGCILHSISPGQQGQRGPCDMYSPGRRGQGESGGRDSTPRISFEADSWRSDFQQEPVLQEVSPSSPPPSLGSP